MTYFPPVQQLHLQVGATLELFTSLHCEKSATLRHLDIAGHHMSLTCHNCHQDHQALPSTSIHEELDGTIDIVVALVEGRSVGSDWRSTRSGSKRSNPWRFQVRKKGSLADLQQEFISLSLYFTSSCCTSHCPYPHRIISMFYA